MPETTPGWFPVFTLLLGYATKSVSEWLQHRRTREREREAREVLRRDELLDRRANFQRQTLLDLQESVMQLVRTAGAMHHQDTMAYRKTGRWQKQLLPEDLSESGRLAHARTLMLSVRVRDDSIRELVKRVKSFATSTGTCATQEESESALSAMVNAFDQLNERLGEILRKLDDEII